MTVDRSSPFTRLTLAAKTTIVAIAMLVALAATILFAVTNQLNASAEAKALEKQNISMRVAWDGLHQYGSGFRVVDGHLYAGRQQLDGFFAPVDRVKVLVGSLATIFKGDVRVATNVQKPDGSRAIGTPLAAGPAYDAVLRDGKPYRGRTVILGTPYFAAYDPIKDASGRTIGVLFVGVPTAEFLTDIKHTEAIVVLVGLVVTLLAATITLLISRAMFRPLTGVRTAMQQLASGDLTIEVPSTERNDEIGSMAKVALVFRETAIAKATADADKVAADTTVRMVVATLGASLAELGSRDLTTGITADYPGPYAAIKRNYNEAIDIVRATIEQVSESARSISTGANEIAQASEDLARRTESNASSLEETSAALVQIEGRLKATATASQSTVARADRAMATVGSGRSTADTAMQAMGRVSGSAKGIDDVIEGLDKIAFQTRVLAMNAAVEAGRAGDAGRGFAVVADLVSALAMRAEEEAKRARDQLSITQSEIVTAVDAVAKVDTALAAISADVGEVNKLLAGMASDNVAQSSAVSEITAAVSTMDRATQQNAAMVEQTSAAARSLTQDVGALTSAAAQFTVEGGDARPAARPAITAPRASIAPRRPAPKLTAVASGHANGKAVNSDWSAF